MKIVVGLGNPGEKYKYTRHNVGFLVLDYINKQYRSPQIINRKNYSFFEIDDNILVYPNTFMNLSGIAVIDVLDDFSCSQNNLLVVLDDIHLKLGNIRIRESGLDGGHNGLKSIIYQLESEEFKRIRLGIGQTSDGIIAENIVKKKNFVLGKFNDEELKVVNLMIGKTAELLWKYLKSGFQEMLNLYSKMQKSV
ncbi:MAG: aminoacyl-tRNA hydrolase [Candidatus Cloacimonadota bacterium]|nr:MAG: aminoacyl-tRNA hydrolase [Candidatus Cloacimonadota bacterium]